MRRCSPGGGTLPKLPGSKIQTVTRQAVIVSVAVVAVCVCPGVDGVCPVSHRAILKELGLQGKVSTYQMAKKWDNLKRRYKVVRRLTSSLI